MIKTISDYALKNKIQIDKLCSAVLVPRATYYRQLKPKKFIDRKKIHYKNALKIDEKQSVLNLLHHEKYIDQTPYEIFANLIDQGKYYCSIRTMYRLLEKNNENQDRRRQKTHRDALKPELIAVSANQVWSWDISKLLSHQKWHYFYLYVIMDIYSRYVVGWLIAERESRTLAKKLIQESCLKQGIQPNQLTLHSDLGPSMKSTTVAQLLAHLGVTKTHSRPYTSNDNPFSESQFKTLKYCPEFPGRFNTLREAELFCRQYFNWYNNHHHHSSLHLLTPQSVHYGVAESILEKRHQTMMDAFQKNPSRFRNQVPKKKTLPKAVWINPPVTASTYPHETDSSKNQAIGDKCEVIG